MASQAKKTQLLARQLFAMSVVDGAVSPDRVAGVLEYVEKHPPTSTLAVLRSYRRLIAIELAKGHALVEHAGAIGEPVLAAIAAAMSRRYSRAVTATAQPSADLLAGIRVRIGDDIYESSVSAQLEALASSV